MNHDELNPIEIHYVQDVMRRLRQLSPDDTECSCLKAIVLFKPGELDYLKNPTFQYNF